MNKVKQTAVILSTLTSLILSAYGPVQSEGVTEANPNVVEHEQNDTPVLKINSTIFGLADTGNKSTLKHTLIKTSGPGDQSICYYDEYGNRAAYEEGAEIELDPVSYTGAAVLKLEADNLDDNKIDSSAAVVKIVDGDGYYPEELILNANTLEGSWKNGTLQYVLDEGDIEWFTGDYPMNDDNSSREWSCFGGDGNGCYTFKFEVSGISYDGQPVDAVTFPVYVYIYGRSAGDLKPKYDVLPVKAGTSGLSQTDTIQWKWIGEGEKPILCDGVTDHFYITWPVGTDASAITAGDVTVTLKNQYGDSYELKADEQFFIFSGRKETQVAVAFQHAAFTPVYNTMTIAVAHGDLKASKTYDVGSVYTYMVQQGGGGVTVDGTVTAYSYYGYEGMNHVNQASGGVTYTLTTEVDGETFYYAEDENSTAYLTKMDTVPQDVFTGGLDDMEKPGDAMDFNMSMSFDKGNAVPEDAMIFDASGAEDCNIRLILNTLYVTTRVDQSEVRTVDGQEILFTKSYDMNNASTGSMEGVTAAPGYVLYTDGISPNQMWAWSERFQAGWEPESGIPVGFPYCGNQSQPAAENTNMTEVPESEAADKSVEIAGSYVFLEDVMGGQLQVPWTLTLNEDMTYELVCENAMMGTSTYTGTFTEENAIVTTSPLEGDGMPIATWFESDYSCQWTLEGDSCVPLKYDAGSEMPANAPGAVSAAYTNVAYASLSSSQVCDIYLPEGEGPFPTIVVVHGGGFAFGAQNMEIVQPIFAAAVEHGYAVVSVDYRKSSEAVFPAALADVKAAVRFVRANAAEYGFDEERIAVWGESAGAYLSLMTALTPEVEELNGDVTDNMGISSGVVALVDFYGPVEFYTMDDEYKSLGVEHDLFASDNSFESKFVGQNVGLDEAVTYQTYWQTYQDSLPDSFALHAWVQVGDADTSVPYTQSENFASRLGKVIGETNVVFGILEGAKHEDAAFYTDENLAEVFAFLDQVMKE
ncbi:MAG: alpha/beta hydrolase [Lachnospiraceae bacterium]|nr:alpha/beta hydrolase [Lachnospiraceae bacterium]